jgi:two-component system OmpR family sensor kinase
MAIVAVVLIGVFVALTVTIQTQLISQVDDRLRSLTPGGPARVQNPPPWFEDLADRPLAPSDDPFSQRISDVYQGFITADGELVTVFAPNFAEGEYPTPDIDPANLDVGEPVTFTVAATDGTITYRVLVQPTGDLISVTGLPIDSVQATIDRLIWLGVAGSMAILIVLGIVGWWVVHLGIRPVKKMTETATRIAGGDLSVRVPELAAGTESGDLAVALNQMLGRIETALDERSRSEERLRRFVADASHELRTPVTSIRGYAELYRLGGLDDPDALTDAMRRTEQEAARMGRLINDMLALARLDEHRCAARQPVDLSQLVRDAAADASASAPERTIAVDAPNAIVVIGDDDQLRQVVANVVSNALVHTDSSVHLRSSSDGSRAVVEVIDQGHGMPPEIVERVTERFFRADQSRSRQSGGSGLGLAIVDAVVAAHGGAIDIISVPDHGTTVRLSFPLASAVGPRPSGPVDDPAAPVELGMSAGSQSSILVKVGR